MKRLKLELPLRLLAQKLLGERKEHALVEYYQTEASFAQTGTLTVWAQFSDRVMGTYDPSVGTVASLEEFQPLFEFTVLEGRAGARVRSTCAAAAT